MTTRSNFRLTCFSATARQRDRWLRALLVACSWLLTPSIAWPQDGPPTSASPYPITSAAESSWSYPVTAMGAPHMELNSPATSSTGNAAPTITLDSDASSIDALPVPPDHEDYDLEIPTNEYVDEPTKWYRPLQWFGPAPWDTGIELGLNGSSGTSDTLSLRAGGYIKRKSRFSKLDMSGYYNRTTEGSVATQNNAQYDVRNDWLLDEKFPWTLFASANLFYDQFQVYDLQINTNIGVGYRFVDDDVLTLIARVGGGAAREFGGPDDEWSPESLFGFEYSQRLSVTQKFAAKIDYYPEWEDFNEYRMVADAGWEIELVQPSNLSLKISANDRIDSSPNGVAAHLVNYSVLLLWKM